MTIKAFRSDETSPRWSNDPYLERIDVEGHELKLSLSMPSKGGGVTEVAFLIHDESFGDLAALMLKASSEAAIRAFGAALSDWHSHPSK